ncbi:MAG: FecR domain-containing protein [Fibrobacter sp.]|nr:FecR domain-containing protein [Fibrobacter sp.]
MVHKSIKLPLILVLGVLISISWGKLDLHVENVVGKAFVKTPRQNSWRDLRVGTKVREKHTVRTGFETSLDLRFPDASIITLGENTTADFHTLVASAKGTQTKLKIKSGSVAFNIKKLATQKSSYEFESSTATAAIRGTTGAFSARGSRSVAYLHTGMLEMKDNAGKTVNIEQKQVALQTDEGFVVLPLPENLSDLNSLIDEYLSDSTSLPTDSAVNTMITTLAEQTKQKNMLCTMDPSPTELKATRIRLSGNAMPGATVSTDNISTVVPENGKWNLDLAWPLEPAGIKEFAVKMTKGGISLDCGLARFNYVRPIAPLKLNLQTPKNINICQPVSISGNYQGHGAQLVLKVGSRRINLSSATGDFNYPLVLTDKNRDWNLKEVVLELSNGETTVSEVISVSVDRKCRAVNTMAPELSVAFNEKRCIGFLSATKLIDDEADIKIEAGGEEIFSLKAASDVRNHQFALKPGTYDYSFSAVDQARNTTLQRHAQIQCYPDEKFSVSIAGPAVEVLKIPPPPPNHKGGIKRTIQTRILNIPENNPDYIKTVTFKFNNRIIRQYKEKQIRELNFYIDVDLDRGGTNKFAVEVEHKSGRVRTAQKEFVFK